MCNNHLAHTSSWQTPAHPCTFYNVACSQATCPKTTQPFPDSAGTHVEQPTEATSTAWCEHKTQDLVDPSAALVIPDSHRNLYSVRHAKISGHTVILRAQAGLLPYGDPELFVPFLEDKSTGLWLLPLLPPPQTHNGVYPFYNTEPSSGHAQRNDYKDSDQGIVHGSTELPFSMESDDGQPTATTRA